MITTATRPEVEMALLDWFTKEGKLKRHVRRMSNRDTPPEDREVSMYWLSDEGSPKALYGLLTRFDMNLSQQLKDRSEKEAVFELLAAKGDQVLEPLQAWLKECRQFAFPVRLLEKLRGEEAAIAQVYALLEAEKGRSSFNPEKKKELLVWLAERRHPEAIEVAAPFLRDFDEEVRYAAVEVMLRQEDNAAREALLGALSNPDEDGNRVKHRLCEAFRLRGWSVEGAQIDDSRLPGGFAVSNDRIVQT